MKLAARTLKTGQSSLSCLFPASKPGSISFAGGLPQTSCLPQAGMKAAFNAVLQNDPAALQYSNSQGFLPLRAKIAGWLSADGVQAGADDILLTQGAQQGLDLTAKMVLDPGDGLAVEAPTYIGALSAFDAYQPTYYEIPMQADGLDVTALHRLLLQHPIKMLYTVPDFQNPTGSVLSLAKRQALVQLAAHFDFLILEDSPYRQLRFAGEQLPSLRSLDPTGHVIQLGSFSKILAPSLRLGWLNADPAYLQQLLNLKAGSDVESSTLTQRAVMQYLRQTDWPKHLAQLRAAYRSKCDLMSQALDQDLPRFAHFEKPAGGFFIWVTLPERFDAQELLKQTQAQGVSFVPGNLLAPTESRHNGLRLNYTNASAAQIQRGIRILSQVLLAEKPQQTAQLR